MNLARIRVVLVRPQHPGNVGAAARAMKNMGLDALVVVATEPLDVEAAAVMAVHARDVLTRHRRFATLAEAVGDCGLVVAASGRPADDARRQTASPRALAPAIRAASMANDVALVFGPEDHGLSNDELARCQRVLAIPTAAAYPSLNLAQAVLVCSYELHLAAAEHDTTDGDPACESAPYTRGRLATAALGEQMYAALERGLRAVGFLHRDNGVHMMRVFRRIFGRAALDAFEMRVVLGLARQITWAAARNHTPAPGPAPGVAPTSSSRPDRRERATASHGGYRT